MPSANIPGNELCYLDRGQGVLLTRAMTHPNLRTGSIAESRWIVWGRSAFAVVVVLVLIGLGVADIAMRLRSHEVEDGVFWSARAEGVVATDIAAGSAGAAAGIQAGDVLIAVNGAPVQTPADVVGYAHDGVPGTRLTYTLLRLGARQALNV
jgi:membrane-associated protease RseP (regulator of RpoE activity)